MLFIWELSYISNIEILPIFKAQKEQSQKRGEKSLKKAIIIAVSVAVVFALIVGGCVLYFAELRENCESIDTPTISIVQGEKHTLTITDKTADKVYSYKTVRVKKDSNNRPPQTKNIETDTISILIDGRVFYIYDKAGNENYIVIN